MLKLNYRYRIYPDSHQQEQFFDWMETCRKAYNYALGEIKDWCNSRKSLADRCSLEKEYIIPTDAPFPSEINQLNSLPEAKKNFPKLKEPPSQVLQQAIKQLHKAWEFFRERGFGFPRFKKYGQFKSLLFPQFKESPIMGWHLKLPKIGLISINLHRPIPEGFKVKQVRIIQKADIWYASINLESEISIPDAVPEGHVVGVDVGLEKFLATSDGKLVRAPKFLAEMQSKLRLLQRRLSRRKKRSKNYEKARIKVARLHHKIDNTRKNFHYQQAHALCNEADIIFMEDLDFRISAKGFLGKQMLDAAFGQFRSIVKYICWKRGKYFAEVDSRGTSQECPQCGEEVKKDLSVRVHECPHCSFTTDRDIASGLVIRNRGIQLISTPGRGGKKTVCAGDLAGTGENLSSQVPKSRQRCDPGESHSPSGRGMLRSLLVRVPLLRKPQQGRTAPQHIQSTKRERAPRQGVTRNAQS